MFNNRTESGRNNIAGIRMQQLRKLRRLSQRQVAEDLAEMGLVVDKNAVQRMESGQRFVTDIELGTIAKYFGITIEELLLLK